MDIPKLDSKYKQVAINSFKETCRFERQQYETKLILSNEAREVYINTLKDCIKHQEQVNTLNNLIEEFGGQVEVEYINFKIEEITVESLLGISKDISSIEEQDVKEESIEDSEDEEDTEQEENSIRPGRKMGIKSKVIEMFTKSSAPLVIADIVKEIKAEFGEDTRYTSITNPIIRLNTSGFLIRLKEGVYDLASRYDEHGNKNTPEMEDNEDLQNTNQEEESENDSELDIFD